MSVTAPLVSSYVQEVDLVEQLLCEACSFGNHLYTKVVVDTCGGFVLQQDAQLLDQQVTQLGYLFVESHIEFFELCLFSGFALLVMACTAEETFVDNHTIK